MSNIEQNLQNILSSKYGKDVRQAIHDSIHDCYEDGKAGATDLIAREQIANLVSMNNPTEGNSELQDIRVGFDGTTYTSAGEAVRGQTAGLMKNIYDFLFDNNIGIIANVKNKYVNSIGEEVTNSALDCTDYVYVKDVKRLEISNKTTYKNSEYRIAPNAVLFDSEKKPIGTLMSDMADRVEYTLPDGVIYIRINQPTSGAGTKYIKFYYDFLHKDKNPIVGSENPITSEDFESADDFEINTIYLISNTSQISNIPFNTFTGTIMTFNYSPNALVGSGTVQMGINGFSSDIYIRTCWGINGIWSNWHRIRSNSYGDYGDHNITFLEENEEVQTAIPCVPGEKIRIISNGGFDSRINVFCNGNYESLVSIKAGIKYVDFIPDSYGRLCFYNVEGFIGTATFNIITGEALIIDDQPKTYHVGTGKDYQSITECLLALKNDEREKTIIIYGGNYDIFQEYTNLGLLDKAEPEDPTMDYFDYNVWVPMNTHIIGKGVVRLIWNPLSTQISKEWSQAISPLNCAGNCTIENIEVICKNGRYALHGDALGDAKYQAQRTIYKNVKFIKYQNDEGYGKIGTVGFGWDGLCYYEFDGCVFKHLGGGYGFYGHTRSKETGTSLGEAQSPVIILNNCIMDTTGYGVRLGNSNNDDLHVPVAFNNCHIGGNGILVCDENSNTSGEMANVYDIVLNRCNNCDITVRDTNNSYPVTIY